MSDLISRKAILEHIEKTRQDALMMDDIRTGSLIMYGMDLCKKAVGVQPSAQPERKKGRWIDMDDHVMCSCCGATHYGSDKNFCPNCGADMRRNE